MHVFLVIFLQCLVHILMSYGLFFIQLANLIAFLGVERSQIS
jgi:hypothetical protein